MSWQIFRSEYKIAQANLTENDKTKMAEVIASSYDKCIKTGLTIGAAPPAPLVSGNVAGLQSMLTTSIIGYGAVPLSVALDNGLKLYWLGGVTAAGATVIVPGITSAYIDVQGQFNESVDDFIEQLITAFKTHLGQVSGAIPGAPPIPFAGYQVAG